MLTGDQAVDAGMLLDDFRKFVREQPETYDFAFLFSG